MLIKSELDCIALRLYMVLFGITDCDFVWKIFFELSLRREVFEATYLIRDSSSCLLDAFNKLYKPE